MIDLSIQPRPLPFTFTSLARHATVAFSLAVTGICIALLATSAYMIRYRYLWDTWHGLAHISSPPAYAGLPIKYIPRYLNMAPYYLTVAVSSVAIFLSFSCVYVNVRTDLHSKYLKHTFQRLPSTLCPILVLLVILAVDAAYTFSADNVSSRFTPYYAQETSSAQYFSILNGTYTLGSFSCQISPWLDGRDQARTRNACNVDAAMKWLGVTSLIIVCVITLLTLFSLRAVHNIQKADRQDQDGSRLSYDSQTSTMVATSTGLRALEADKAEKGIAELDDQVEQKYSWSTVQPTTRLHSLLSQRTEPTASLTIQGGEKGGREVFETDGWARVELPGRGKTVELGE